MAYYNQPDPNADPFAEGPFNFGDSQGFSFDTAAAQAARQAAEPNIIGGQVFGPRKQGGKQGWKYPMTGKPVVDPTTDPTTPPKSVLPPAAEPAAAWDFWGNVTTLLGDEVTPEQIGMLQELWAQDPKWKAPSGAKAKRLWGIASTLKNLGYGDQLGEVVNALFQMGYSQPAFSLSMFNSLLKPYGLGSSSSSAASSGTSGDVDIAGLLGM
jgi:hypothetical protein